MLIRSEDVKSLEHWNADTFTSWLIEGTCSWSTNAGAFAPLHKVFVPTEPLEDQLAEVYRLLPTDQQKLFREALTRTIRASGYSPQEFHRFEMLVHLAGRVEAVEALSALVHKVTSEFFTKSCRASGRKETFALVFSVVAGLAHKTAKDKARSYLEDLSYSPLYDKAYDPMLQEALK